MSKRNNRKFRASSRQALKRFSSSAMNGGQTINFDAHYNLNRSHIESMGMADTGRGISASAWKAMREKLIKEEEEEKQAHMLELGYSEAMYDKMVDTPDKPMDIPRRMHREYEPLPKTIPLDNLIAEKLRIPKTETNKLRKRITNGKVQPRWHQVNIRDDQWGGEYIYFFENKAFWMELDKRTNMQRMSAVYPSLERAKQAKGILPPTQFWGEWKPFKVASQ